MKALILIAILFLAFIGAKAQCVVPTGFVCITQTQADKISKDLDELKAAKVTIAAFANERLTTDNERAAFKSFMTAADTAMTVLQKGIADRESLIALQTKTLELYATLVEKLTAKIDAPKSAWSKFLTTLKEIAFIAAGVSIGRGHL